MKAWGLAIVWVVCVQAGVIAWGFDELEEPFGWPAFQVPEEVVEHEDTYISSMWAQCLQHGFVKATESAGFVQPDIESEEVRLRNVFLRKPLRYQKLLQKDKEGHLVKAPLVVYFNGVFAYDKNSKSNLMRLFHGWGYHVISLPHPWSLLFISAKPQFSLGHLEYEARVLLQVLQQQKELLSKDDHLDGIHLVGLSHGAILATAVAAFNTQLSAPLPIEGVTGLSPPYHLDVAKDRLDRMMDDTEKRYRGMTGLHVLMYARSICKKHKRDMPQRIDKAKTLVAWLGFQNPIVDALYKYEKEVGLPSKDPLPHVFRRDSLRDTFDFKTKLRFRSILKNYFPDVIPVIRNKGGVAYWVNQALEGGFQNFRYIVTQNDFLNNPGAWSREEGPSQHIMQFLEENKVDMIVLPYGGHYGYSHKKWFWDLMRNAFKQ